MYILDAVDGLLKEDPINPFHYKGDGIEAIQVIEGFHLDFYNGTVVLYMLRAGRKDGVSEIQDLRKAKWYLDRKIERLEKEEKEQMGRAFSPDLSTFYVPPVVTGLPEVVADM